MKDIVVRLRQEAIDSPFEENAIIMEKAATKIEELRSLMEAIKENK